jgi:hypothetical protein
MQLLLLLFAVCLVFLVGNLVDFPFFVYVTADVTAASPTSSRTPCCCCNYFVASPFSAIHFSLYGVYVVGFSLSSVFSPRCSLHGRVVCIPE